MRAARQTVNSSSDYDYAQSKTNSTAAVAMNQSPEELWLAFEALAKTYPHDDGVHLTANLARWLIEERQRLQVPIPAVMHQSIQAVVKVTGQSPDSPTDTKPRRPATRTH